MPCQNSNMPYAVNSAYRAHTRTPMMIIYSTWKRCKQLNDGSRMGTWMATTHQRLLGWLSFFDQLCHVFFGICFLMNQLGHNVFELCAIDTILKYQVNNDDEDTSLLRIYTRVSRDFRLSLEIFTPPRVLENTINIKPCEFNMGHLRTNGKRN